LRISSVKTRLTEDSGRLYFRIRATSAVPAGATAAVTINYEHTPEKPEDTELPDSEFEPRWVSEERPLREIIIDGQHLEGFVDVSEIYESLIEDYEFTATFGAVSIKLEEAVLAEAQVELPVREIEQIDDPPTATTVQRVWANHKEWFYTRQFWVSNAFLDLSNAVNIEVYTEDRFGFPGVFAPQQIDEEGFNALLSQDPDEQLENNGKIYSIKLKAGGRKIGILFANPFRIYAEYFDLDTVYQLSVSYRSTYTRQIATPKIIKTANKEIQITIKPIEIPSTNFQYEISEALAGYSSKTVLFDQRTLPTLGTESSFSINQFGYTNTDAP
jgi:hypothetical protein